MYSNTAVPLAATQKTYTHLVESYFKLNYCGIWYILQEFVISLIQFSESILFCNVVSISSSHTSTVAFVQLLCLSNFCSVSVIKS